MVMSSHVGVSKIISKEQDLLLGIKVFYVTKLNSMVPIGRAITPFIVQNEPMIANISKRIPNWEFVFLIVLNRIIDIFLK